MRDRDHDLVVLWAGVPDALGPETVHRQNGAAFASYDVDPDATRSITTIAIPIAE